VQVWVPSALIVEAGEDCRLEVVLHPGPRRQQLTLGAAADSTHCRRPGRDHTDLSTTATRLTLRAWVTDLLCIFLKVSFFKYLYTLRVYKPDHRTF
jgi:hypothetical protein